MLRIRVIVSFLVMTVAMVIVAMVAVGHYEEGQLRSLERQIEGSENAYQRLQDLRELRMRSVASAIANSEVSAVLATLHDDAFGSQMSRVERELNHRFRRQERDKTDPEILGRRMAYLEGVSPFLNDFLDELEGRNALVQGLRAWPKAKRAAFRAEYKKLTLECLSVNKQTCWKRLPMHALKKVMHRLSVESEFGIRPDAVAVADDKLRLRALHGAFGLGGKTTLGKYAALRSVVPSKVNARPQRYVHDIVAEEGRTYFVTAHGVMDEQGRHVGAVLVGVQIDENLVKAEAKALGRDVTYIGARSRRTLRSSLRGPLLQEIEQNLPAGKVGSVPVTLRTSHLVGQVVPLKDMRSNAAPMVVFSSNRLEALTVVHGVGRMIPFAGFAFFIFGTLLLLWAVKSHIDALIEVDTGIHEVISGNSAYEFEFDYGDEGLSAMAQSLNLMVAVLTGRDQGSGSDSSWMEGFMDDESADASSVEASQDTDEAPNPTEPVPSPTPSLSAADVELSVEPAESYYRRVYSEFIQGRRESGEGAISYVRFVEKVVRQERVLRNQLACRMVRFRVVQRDDGPALLPVKID